jgi:hypothetical protein
VNEDNFLLAPDVGYNACMRYIPFLTGFGNEEKPVANADFFQLAYFLAVF